MSHILRNEMIHKTLESANSIIALRGAIIVKAREGLWAAVKRSSQVSEMGNSIAETSKEGRP